MKLTVGSVFSGIEGFGVGLERAGYRVRWQVENHAACTRVLAQHWPDVLRLGDVTTVDPGQLSAVDLLCGGFPCQDLSVAGKRVGLAGQQSGLFWQFHRLARTLRPTWLLVENVPGLYSSRSVDEEDTADQGDAAGDGGIGDVLESGDFGTIIDALVDLGYGVAWRCLDARYFGVAQRRRRVFFVCHLGEPWSAPGEVLFEPESVYGYPPQSAEAGADLAGTLGGGAGRRGWASDTERMTFVSHALTGHWSSRYDPNGETYVIANGQGDPNCGVDLAFALDTEQPPAVYAVRTAQTRGNGWGVTEDESHTLDGAQGQAIVFEARVARNGRGAPSDIAPPLKAENGRTGKGDGAPLVFDPSQITSRANYSNPSPGNPSHPLASGAKPPTIAITGPIGGGNDGIGQRSRDDPNLVVSPSLRSNQRNNSNPTTEAAMHVTDGTVVRRLTPLEAERLQGFPDGWTASESNAARYRMLGNAVCTNVAEWIGRRLIRVHERLHG